MAIDEKLIDQLLASRGSSPLKLAGENGLLKELTKALVERAMKAELTHHLGYEKHDPAGRHSGNSRNGSSRKKLIGDFGELEVETPRDRNGTFEPRIIAKHQTRWTGFDDRILSMYARGMSTREIQGHLQEIYGVEVQPELRSFMRRSPKPQHFLAALQVNADSHIYGPILHMPVIAHLHVQRVEIHDRIHLLQWPVLPRPHFVLNLFSDRGNQRRAQVLTEMCNRGILTTGAK